jgi:hypothetical protein
MRLFKLLPALAAVSALFVLAPAGASAAPSTAHSSLNNCRVSLAAEPRTITSGESAQLFGQLRCLSGSTEGQTVTLYGHTPGLPFKEVGKPTTGPAGFYSMIQSGITMDTIFYVHVLTARSPNRAVRVAPIVTFEGPPEGTQLKTGFKNKVTFTGKMTPADVGAPVVLQREGSASFEEWRSIERAVVGAGGAYTITHAFAVPGQDANLRVIVPRHGTFTVRGISSTLSYEITQAQHKNLTIHSSTDPIAYGATTTISGILAGGAGKTVTLMGHTFPGHVFVTLTSTPADGSGGYKFLVAPLANTAYQVSGTDVSGKTIRSAMLFQGVKYLLTANASGKTVQSGQSLTFSGTVTPGNLGKVVYLERENLFGGGFHVTDVGTVTAASTYSITHFIFGSGKAVFRVKVPGDPSNQSVASTTFPVEITAAPPAALKPVTPAKLPSEGQH